MKRRDTAIRFTRSAAVVVALVLATAAWSGQVPSSPATRTDGVIRFWQWKVARDPDDFFNYDRLGAAYIQKARETGDITWYGLAEQALKKSLALESTDREAVSALTHMATVCFGEHRFTDAIDYANRAAAIRKDDVSEYATIGDAQLELGKYDDATRSFVKLRGAEASAEHGGPRLEYLTATRFAALDFVQGRAAQSIEELRHAVEVARAAQLPGENLAWTQFMLGEELFLTGHLTEAEQSYRDALASYPKYHRALAGMGKVRAAQGRYDDAVECYQQAIAIIPMPIYAAALGDVYKKMGRDEEAEKQYALVEYIARLSALNQIVYNRELAIFDAEHDRNLPEALALAKKELGVRGDIYTHDALGLALYKNGHPADAAHEADAATRLGTPDPMLYLHAGLIYRAAGKQMLAAQAFRRALALNPEFHVLFAGVARDNLREIVAAHGKVVAQGN